MFLQQIFGNAVIESIRIICKVFKGNTTLEINMIICNVLPTESSVTSSPVTLCTYATIIQLVFAALLAYHDIMHYFKLEFNAKFIFNKGCISFNLY